MNYVHVLLGESDETRYSTPETFFHLLDVENVSLTEEARDMMQSLNFFGSILHKKVKEECLVIASVGDLLGSPATYSEIVENIRAKNGHLLAGEVLVRLCLQHKEVLNEGEPLVLMTKVLPLNDSGRHSLFILTRILGEIHIESGAIVKDVVDVNGIAQPGKEKVYPLNQKIAFGGHI